MKKVDLKKLKEVLYEYWMQRVPQLTEYEAIDHLEWELRSQKLLPKFEEGKRTRDTKKRLKTFLKNKGIT